MDDCIFCQIAKGKLFSHKIWESEKHLAFLSIFPNTPGFSVVITKEHRPSYVFDLRDSEVSELMLAAKAVALQIDHAFDDVGRTGCLIEGFGIDHAHVKLFPMHGTKGKWQRRNSNVNKYFTHYEGYISSHDYIRAEDSDLEAIAKKIRNFSL